MSTLTAGGTLITNDGDRSVAGNNILDTGDTIVLVFNKDIDAATASTIKLYDETNKAYIPGGNGVNAITYTEANKTATFTVGTGVSVTNARFRVEATGVKTLAGGTVDQFKASL